VVRSLAGRGGDHKRTLTRQRRATPKLSASDRLEGERWTH
jgi:hypothetical protein